MGVGPEERARLREVGCAGHLGQCPTPLQLVQRDLRVSEAALTMANERAERWKQRTMVERAKVERVDALLTFAERQTAASISTDFNGNKFERHIPHAALRAALDGEGER